MSQGIEKTVYEGELYDRKNPNLGALPPHETRRFVWSSAAGGSGWLLLLELDGDGNVLRKLTWGRDLSGSLDGAGGIGGLLAIQDANGTTTGENHESDDLRYVYFYDANGNVGQVIDLAAASASASIKARYEYDPYGNPLLDAADPNQSGPYASANPYRFSTKPWDDETGFGYWGYRYYDPRLGRWISRDPIEELGGENLYASTRNQPTGFLDAQGLYCGLPGCAGSGGSTIPTPDPCPQSGGTDHSPDACAACQSAVDQAWAGCLRASMICNEIQGMTCKDGTAGQCPGKPTCTTDCRFNMTYDPSTNSICVKCSFGADPTNAGRLCPGFAHEMCHARQRCVQGPRTQPPGPNPECLQSEAECYAVECRALGNVTEKEFMRCCREGVMYSCPKTSIQSAILYCGQQWQIAH